MFCNNNSEWIWIVILIVLIFSCGDSNILGRSGNGCGCSSCNSCNNECC